MEAQVLGSRGCLQYEEALTLTESPVRLRRNYNPNPKFASQSRRRKRSPVALQANRHDRDRIRHCDRSMVEKAPAANLVTSQVKIMNQSQKLSPENGRPAVVASTGNPKVRAKSEEGRNLVSRSTDLLGLNSETMQKKVRVRYSNDALYAGSAFSASPPPSSVPVPGFLGKMRRQ